LGHEIFLLDIHPAVSTYTTA